MWGKYKVSEEGNRVVIRRGRVEDGLRTKNKDQHSLPFFVSIIPDYFIFIDLFIRVECS